MVVTSQIRAALRGHDEAWLAQQVSQLEGRRCPYQAAARDWIERPEAQEPARIFAIEAVLGLPPASLSRRLGYLPADMAAGAWRQRWPPIPRGTEIARRVLIGAYRAARERRTYAGTR